MKITKDLRKTAYHEAGHAVAFMRLFESRYPGRLTIISKDGVEGSHSAEELIFPYTESETPEQREAFENEAIYACSGYAALVAAGYSKEKAEQGCDSDFQKAQEGSNKPLEAVKQEAVLLMSQPDNVRAVSRIAEELIKEKTLEPDQVDILLDVADGNITEEEYSQYLMIKQSKPM